MSERKHRRPLYPSVLASASICLSIGVAAEGPKAGVFLGLLGALFGLYVSGVIRLFPVHPAGFALVGMFMGPLPLCFIGARSERGGMVLFGLALGALLGLLEWSLEARRPRVSEGAVGAPLAED